MKNDRPLIKGKFCQDSLPHWLPDVLEARLGEQEAGQWTGRFFGQNDPYTPWLRNGGVFNTPTGSSCYCVNPRSPMPRDSCPVWRTFEKFAARLRCRPEWYAVGLWSPNRPGFVLLPPEDMEQTLWLLRGDREDEAAGRKPASRQQRPPASTLPPFMQ